MQITRETDYAVRCVIHLAETDKEVVMVREIALESEIPKSFLAKILQKLSKGGIVQSLRGVKGGYQLAKQPSEISLLDVLEAMDGPCSMNICAIDKERCNLSATCSAHPLWVEVRKDVEARLRKWNFATLSDSRRRY